MERGILNYLASSHFNPEIKQHKNMTILGWDTAKEFLVLLAWVKILCWLKASPKVIVYSVVRLGLSVSDILANVV